VEDFYQSVIRYPQVVATIGGGARWKAVLGSERADLVRQIAGETEYTAQDSENARFLTMLHRGLPPEEVTPKKIQSTFWELRNELITTREFWEEMKKRKAKKK